MKPPPEISGGGFVLGRLVLRDAILRIAPQDEAEIDV
jgi:hypothetical protein